MKLEDLDTPCLILDRQVFLRNLSAMRVRVERHGVTFRPHLKTAKSADIARLVVSGEGRGITVSTLAEAEYFASHGFRDMILAAGITPAKLHRAGVLVAEGVRLLVITDDVETAAAIRTHPAAFETLIEIDSGDARGGVSPESGSLMIIARALGEKLAGVLTHGGHSYAARSVAALERAAEDERRSAVSAAERLRNAGMRCDVVSVGSTPTAVHARDLTGVTELRAGVYMFNDLFQAEIGSCSREDIALTVLSSVIGRRPGENRVILDAGALALSKDRSTERTSHDAGFGLVWAGDGKPRFGECRIERVFQEHGVATSDQPLPFDALPVGARVRVAPNHACLTAAAYDRYHVVEGGDEVVAIWDRVNGW